VSNVIVYAPADEADKKKNRGFCFVDFDTHKDASAAKRKLSNARVRVRKIMCLKKIENMLI
jgi:heterogeneous nuclear ribonucleoprotein R